VSGFHCELSWDDNQFWLKDLDSTNGTYVNGARIQKPTQIFPKKSTIHIGTSQLLLITEERVEDEESSKLALGNLLSAGSIVIPGSGFFQKQKIEESLVVVDICKSTVIANRYGENALLRIVYTLAEILTRHAEANEVQFLKCTGDGFFATFRETKQALCVVCSILQDIQHIASKKPETPRFSLRTAIHRGLVSSDKTGDRLGLACHLVFRLQGTKPENLISAPETACELPKENPIFLTDEAIHSLDKNLSNCFAYVGDFRFKGFDKPVRVNIVAEDTKILLEGIS